MRILAITAGAGTMYCGSCLRDNSLARQLLSQGHDVMLLPVYTPTITDEENVSEDRVFLGGISVYLEQHVPFLRRTPAIFDKLWDSPSVIRAVTNRGVSTNAADLAPLTVSTLRGDDGFQAKEIRKLIAWLVTQERFDIVVLPTSLLAGLAPALKRELGAPVVCTLQGEDLFLEGLPEVAREECKALIRSHAPFIDAFVAVSDYYAGFMTSYIGLPAEKMRVIPLGIRAEDFFPRVERPPRAPFTVGYFARVAPEKGLHVLVEAYALMRREHGVDDARLDVGGYLAPEHRSYLADVEAQIRRHGLEKEYTYHGVLDREQKAAFLQNLDAFSVPSPYVEPKGLYLLEALATGVPVVSPHHGALPEILAKTGGGVTFPPNDVPALAKALATLAGDLDDARRLGEEGAEGVRLHYDARRMAERALVVYGALVC